MLFYLLKISTSGKLLIPFIVIFIQISDLFVGLYVWLTLNADIH